MNRIKDQIDRRLIALLTANARQSTVSLAKRLGLARTTVHERMERLERSGVIQGYTAVLDHAETEASARCLVLLAILQKRQRAIVERIMTFPEVKTCAAINGEFDLMLCIEAPLNEDLQAVMDEIALIEGVERSRSFIVLSTKFERRESGAWAA